jgi:conjugative transposon TraM protein
MNIQKPISAKQEMQRKFLLVLPLLVLPFLTFLLLSVGLISPTKGKAEAKLNQHRFNEHLPDARIKEEKGWNKLNFYEQADKDSAKYREQLKNDPYSSGRSLNPHQPPSLKLYNPSQPDNDPSPASNNNYEDPNVEKVNQKLEELNAALNKPAIPHSAISMDNPAISSGYSLEHKDVNRLENMLQTISQKDTSSDPDMQQLGGMMDKILDIQHPERVKERIREQSQKNKKEVFPVTTNIPGDNITLLQAKQVLSDRPNRRWVKDTTIQVQQPNAFYSLDENVVVGVPQNAMEAVVNETQIVVNGSSMKLRLVNDVYINGILVPKNNFFYGVASLNGERLNIVITTIHYQNNILPVALSVYDLDGLPGIYIPGAITRDVAKQSADESLQGIGLTTVDPSIGAQAASAGIQTVKNLIGKKVKLVRVTVKAGYQVLLRDNNQK